jgi:phosphate-selective porin OprO/OprP
MLIESLSPSFGRPCTVARARHQIVAFLFVAFWSVHLCKLFAQEHLALPRSYTRASEPGGICDCQQILCLAGGKDDEFIVPLMAAYRDGFSLHSADDQLQMRLRFLTQIDAKLFTPTDQEPARSGMYIPRFRTYFEGQLRDGYEYELSLQRSVEGTFDLLDANVNFRPHDAFQLRIGRSLTPYSYAWYDHLEQFYITPERGLVPLNFGLARQVSAIVHGNLADDMIEYAVGPAFGHISGLADTNATREGVGYLNLRPFSRREGAIMKNLNIGGSLALGRQSLASTPLPLRTSIQTSENDEAAQAASTIFMEFNNTVLQNGTRQQGALHAANYYGPWSVEAEFYALTFEASPIAGAAFTTLPVLGYDIQVARFLTGETVERRELVNPLRPYGRGANAGFGAVELFGRYSTINISDKIFTAGLAEEAEWTNGASVIDVGFNWYLNRFVKVASLWQHSTYDTPVLLNRDTGKRSTSSELFWTRLQLYF